MTTDDETPARGQPRRGRYLVVAVVLAVFAGAAVAVAVRSDPATVAGRVDVAHLPVGPPAPAVLGDANGWINSKPLRPVDLHGHVVVYDFWTYSCVNCVRTLPHLEAWQNRYARDGLVIVGVHSPEFDFEKDHDNVAAAVKRLHVNYPVALDDNLAIWNQFGNQYWPEKYVADRQGRVRYTDIGEGSYGQTEDVLRKLLGVSTSAPRASVGPVAKAGAPPTQNEDVTGETYLALERGTAAAQPGLHTYPEPHGLAPGDARLVGPWTADQQQVVAAAPGAAILLRYRAREVNLVMAPNVDGTPVDVTITLDGKPLAPDQRSTETMVDAPGTTFVRVSTSDLYRLVLAPSIESHTLRLTTRGSGLQAFAFTFGG